MRRGIPVLILALAACAPAVKAPEPSRTEAAATPAAPSTAAAPAPKPATSARAPAKGAPPATAAKAPAAAKAPTAVAAAPAGPAPLDLKTLEQQLRETKAIGVMTKLSLKNQVDDLLEQFRAYYQGRLKTTLAELRRPYEMLLMKVLSVLQDGDPALARAIHASRESIWGILADREKFAKVGS